MCGIVGYVGKREAYPILIKGLKRLEYRGYDSAGVALISDSGELNVYKQKGKVADLEQYTADKDCSGQIGLDPATGTMVEGVVAQANRAFDNLEAVLAQAGAKMTDVVKFTIFLTDINDFSQVNEVMAAHVPTPSPARSCMQVAALPKGALVEVEAIAVI